MLSLQTNVTSLIAQQNLNVNSAAESKTIAQLTSGYRINSSGDDAAGLSVANKYRSDTAELTQGVRNANDATSQLQIVDGGLNNISQILDRMKTLATEAATSTFTGDPKILNNEFTQLTTELTRQATNIGLDGSGNYFKNAMSVYIGGGTLAAGVATVGIDLTGNAVDATGLGLKTEDLTTTTGATTAIGDIEKAIGTLGTVQGKVGAGENELNYATNLAQSQITNQQAAESQIRDADVASAASSLTKDQVLSQASVAAMAQANAMPQAVLKLLQ